jgi:hypothetical protein
MKETLHRHIVASLHRFYDSPIYQFTCFTILVYALLFPLAACAQFPSAETGFAHSTSGQFIVTGGQQVSWLAGLPAIATNTDLVRLEPALLAVSAERLKESLRRQLGISQSAPWSGKIFLVLHPAQSPDESVTVISSRFGSGWNYRVELPDIVSRTRLARALTGVLLLEFANCDAQSHSAEIPAWLNDGLSQQLSAAGSPENLLSLPYKIVNGLAVAEINATQRGIDPMAVARQVLKNSPALTFEQLSWPDDNQVSGADGGVYRASAQLFVNSLLGLKNGAADLREMLQDLPHFYNWQIAFQNAFRENFQTPLDVEKWWALQAVDFAAHDPGPQWTPAVSRIALDEILSVPVEMRATSNNLPVYAEISLQAVIRNFDPAQQTPILQAKLRDLELAQFHMTAPLPALSNAYRRIIGDYLDGENLSAPPSTRRATNSSQNNGVDDAVEKLDALDAQRRTIEDAIKPDDSTPQSLNASAP